MHRGSNNSTTVAAGQGPVSSALVGAIAMLVALTLVFWAGTATAASPLNDGIFGEGYNRALHVVVHLLGFLVIGLWAQLHESRGIWELPLVALLGAVIAGVVASANVDLPYAEEGLPASLILVGLLVAIRARGPMVGAIVVVAVAAVFHGYPNGVGGTTDLDAAVFWGGYALGALLVLAAGIGLARIATELVGRALVQVLGALVAAAGVVFLLDVLGQSPI